MQDNKKKKKKDMTQQELEELRIQKFMVKGGRIYGFFKRVFDIFWSLLAIILLSWLMLIIGILVKLTSKGPMIYVSDRIGKNGKVFKFYKFRSMYVDADAKLESLLKDNEVKDGPIFKMKDDPRITKFGKFIRKTSLDELPQLFNILKGDMSIVGPRPCTTREYDLMINDPELKEYIETKVKVPQGLTCIWQCSGRSNTGFEAMKKYDIMYIKNKRGFFYDLYLIIKTVFVVIFGKGAE